MKLISFFDFSFKNFINIDDKVSLSQKSETRLFYLSLLSSLMAVYLLSIQKSHLVLMTKQILFMLVPTILGLRSLYLMKLNIWYVFASAVVVCYAVTFKRFDAISDYVLISWCYFTCLLRPKININDHLVYGVAIVLCLIVAAHLSIFEMYGRRSIGGLDPNYSGFLIFLLFPFAIFLRSWSIVALIFFVGISTQSKSFLVSSIVMFIVWQAVLRLEYLKHITYKNYILGFLVLFSCLMLFSYYVIIINHTPFDDTITSGYERLFQIYNNNSNYERFKANTDYLTVARRDSGFLLLGLSPEEYFSKVSKYLPHNLPLLVLSNYGIIVGSLFLVCFVLVIRNVYAKEFFSYFISLFVYWLTLGVEVGAIYNVALINLMIFLRKRLIVKSEYVNE